MSDLEVPVEVDIHQKIIDVILAVFEEYSDKEIDFHGVYEVKSDKKNSKATLILGNFPMEFELEGELESYIDSTGRKQFICPKCDK